MQVNEDSFITVIVLEFFPQPPHFPNIIILAILPLLCPMDRFPSLKNGTILYYHSIRVLLQSFY